MVSNPTKKKKVWPLNKRQRLFIEKLFELGVPTKAYREAGYKGVGHSAETGAWLLMTNPNIKLEIERRLALIDNQVNTQLRTLTDVALKTLKNIIIDRESRLIWDKEKKIYVERDAHLGASAGVRRQAISDLFGWIGLNPATNINIDSRVKNQTLLEVIKAKKLLDKGKPDLPVKRMKAGRPKRELTEEEKKPFTVDEGKNTNE